MLRLAARRAVIGAVGVGTAYSQSDTVKSVVDGVRKAPFHPVPKDHFWKDRERANLNRKVEACFERDETHWSRLLASVNYELDVNKIKLAGTSGESLAYNAELVADGQRSISGAHFAEATTFLMDRNASGNDYGSCMVGLGLHSLSFAGVGALEMLAKGPPGTQPGEVDPW